MVPFDLRTYSKERDSIYSILNADKIAAYSRLLANTIETVRAKGKISVVLGGDCSIITGCMLALKREGRFGLASMDGHADFFQPEAEPNGEATSMDLEKYGSQRIGDSAIRCLSLECITHIVGKSVSRAVF